MGITSFIGGCIGGGAGIIVGHPLDTVKVRMQAQHGSGDLLKYKGVLDCFHKILKFEGVNGLYKGVKSPLIGVSVQNALLFGIQRHTMKYFGHDIWGEFKSGCFTGALQTIISTPVELSKIQLQMQNIDIKVSKSSDIKFGPFSVLLHLYKTEGFRGLFRGYLVTLIRDTPGYGVYFASYAYFCNLLTSKTNNQTTDTLSISRLLLAGGLCGIMSWIVIYPLDIIKTRVQTEGFQPTGRYKNYLACIQECYSEGGTRIFTRGLGTTVIRAFPVNAATLCTVSLIERLFNRNHTEL